MIQTVGIYLTVVIAGLLCLYAAFVFTYRSFIGREAPFMRSPWMAVNLLRNFIHLDKSSVFYDLGCGDGRVMRAFFETYRDSNFIGIEKNTVPFWAFYLRNGDIMGKKFQIRRADVFKSELSDATHIFLHLYPSVIARLEEKLEKELAAGTIVLSLDFPFAREPFETLKFFDRSKKDRFIYAYKF